MEKIPLWEGEPAPPPPVSTAFLRDALEILLLGSLWLFALVWLPFYQQADGPAPGLLQLQHGVSGALALVLGLVGGLSPGSQRPRPAALGVLAGIAVLAVSLAFSLLPFAPGLTATVQALLGLAYFILVRLR